MMTVFYDEYYSEMKYDVSNSFVQLPF